MPKPKSIAWLEEQTGQRIDYTPESERPERHLSVRLGGDLSAALDCYGGRAGVDGVAVGA